MKSLKTLLIAATVAAVTTLAGCSSVAQVVDRGNALRDANPAAYEAITGEQSYFSTSAQYNVHGS